MENENVLLTVPVPRKTDSELRKIAFSRGIKKSEVINEYIGRGIAGEPPTIAQQTQDRGHVLRLIEELHLLSGTVGDLRKGFAPSVDPKRWVEQVQHHIERTLATVDVQSR